MQGANKVIFNTGITYAKAVITSVISLYATRLVLNALGAEDFGLYNVIAGMIAMLAFLNAAMTTSTQRYLSFNLGKGDLDKVRNIFANSVIIHFCIGILLVIAIEAVGLYAIFNILTINPERVQTASYILHFAVASTFLTIISVPYEAVINAHENMTFLAIVSIIESLLKFATAVSIVYLPVDKLFYYGMFTMLVVIIIRIIKQVYSKSNYPECNGNLRDEFNKEQITELTSFAGWNLFGILCALGRNQGVAIVLNIFYGTVVNAAYGVANQINAQLMFFSQTMMSAMRPQIMKSEGANDRERMIRLALIANKFSFFLFSFFAMPLFFEMPFILKLWLKNVPEYSVEFCRSIILATLFLQLNTGLMTAIQAIGKIKVYQVVAGSIQLLTLPIGFLFLKLGHPPYSIMVVAIVLEVIATAFRMFYFSHLTGHPVKHYFKNVIVNSLVCLAPTAVILYFVQQQIESGWLNLLTIGIISSVFYSISIYLLGLDRKEKEMFKQLIQAVNKKFLKKA